MTKSFDRCFREAVTIHKMTPDSKVLQVASYVGRASSSVDPRWKKIPPNFWTHYVVLIKGGTVLDPTARQFGKSQKTKYGLSELKKRWNKIYEVTI